MAETDPRVLLLIDLFLLALTVLGAAVWTGRWRSWTESDIRDARAPLLLPSFAMFFLILRVGILLRDSLQIQFASESILVPAIAFQILGFISSWWNWPKWALPPWYRDHLKHKR